MNYLAGIFGLQWQELVVILIIVLVLFGPKQLPKLGKMLGRGLKDFKDATKNIDADGDDDEEPVVRASQKEKVQPAAPVSRDGNQ